MHIKSKRQTDTLSAAPIPDRLKKQQKVAILTTDNTEDLEFFYPYYRLNEAGYQVDVITPEGNPFKAKHGYEFNETKSLSEVRAEDYELLYIPGGKAPAKLREDGQVLTFVREFALRQRPLAAICHGAQLLATADLIGGKRIAAWPEIRGEIEEAGGIFVDEALVIDDQFITARMPGDLHRHMHGIINTLEGKMDRTSRPNAAA